MNDKLNIIVNPEDKKVICIATDCELDVIKDIVKRISSKTTDVKELFINDLMNSEDLIITNKFVGIAKCSPDDVFDAEYGKKLAIKKMRYKYNNAKQKAIKKYLNKITGAMDLTNELLNWYTFKTDNSNLHLNIFLEKK